MVNDSSVSVVGLGKLGVPMVACFADAGYRVIGVDIDQARVDFLQNGTSPIEEPGVDELLTKNKHNVSATINFAEAIENSSITFVVVPTPSLSDGKYSTEYAVAALQKIGNALRKKSQNHLVVLTSTVLPGDCDSVIIPALESSSGRECGKDVGFCYSPEFIALGSVVHDLRNPDFYLIGESDEAAGEVLEKFYSSVSECSPPCLRMSHVNAELAKIAVNTYVTMKISYANMLAEICEGLPGADVDVVTRSVGSDARIGSRYLKGALGYGGPCFPRDNLAFLAVARSANVSTLIPHATHEQNGRQPLRVVRELMKILPGGSRVGVLGLAYKANTPVIEASQGLQIAQGLIDEGYRVVVFDALALANAQIVLGDRAQYAENLQDCLVRSDAAVLTLDSCAVETDFAYVAERLEYTIFDCWRSLDPVKLPPNVTYYVLGRYQLGWPDTDSTANR